MTSKEREQITILCEKIRWVRKGSKAFNELAEELLALLDRVLDKTEK